ncbi:AAA family ATPase [Pseudomonas typographi]|uniref:AAA family ATPase n=1 Tax=Pseudomonas typographi TaxID=2715964 RepID=A0ABR7Z2D7_9PSED|nr:AAA family ATPase [Pseudomonas typographi]MBD1599582.1 AAA family ATPase [Pseudomonas typographi]
MKILAIRLKNLASLAGPVTLDFTAEPLASAGLFAITGPTGAGKSTILDALCLALFGAVPRLGDITPSAKVPDAEGEIGTSDPRTLLRRGTGAGFAEVDFVGVDGRRYRARWEANRARDKADGKLQASRQSLTDLDAKQLLASQKGEYKTQLETRLGLNFAQFTRAVLLAQSDFSAFLKADDNERSELLEKLTDTGLYTRLGRRAFDKAKATRLALDALQAEARGVAPLEAEARQALEAELAQASGALKAAAVQQRQAEQAQQWYLEGDRLAELKAQAYAECAAASAALEGLAGERHDLHLLEQLAPQRHLFARQQHSQAQLATWQAQHAEHAQALAVQREAWAGLQQQQAALQSAVEQAEQAQQAAAPALRQAFDESHGLATLEHDRSPLAEAVEQARQAVASDAEHLQQLRERQAHSEQRLAQLAEQLAHSTALAQLADTWAVQRPRLQQALAIAARLAQGDSERPALQHAAEQAAGEMRRLQQALDELYREAGGQPHELGERLHILTQLLAENRTQLRDTEALERAWQQVADYDLRLAQLALQQQRLGEQRQARTDEGLAVRKQHETASAALELTLRLIERQRLARDSSVEALRQHLQPEQPCPVCGSLEHPWHQPEPLMAAIAGQDAVEEQQARQQVEQCSNRLAELRAEVAGLIEQQKQLREQEQPLQQQRQACQVQLEQMPLYARLAQLPTAEQGARLVQRRERLGQQIAGDEQQQAQLMQWQQQTGQLQQHLRQAEQAAQASQQQWDDHLKQLASDRQRLDEELASLAQTLPQAERDALLANPAEAFMALDQRVAARLEQLRQQLDEQQEHREREQRLQLHSSGQQAREQQLNAQHAQLAALDAKREAAQQRLAGLLAGQPSPSAWQQQLEQAVASARQALAQCSEHCQAAHTDGVRLDSELSALQAQVAGEQANAQALGQALAEWRAQHPQLDDATLARLLACDDAHTQALRGRQHSAHTALAQAQALLQEREQRWQAHQGQAADAPPREALEQQLVHLRSTTEQLEHTCASLRARQLDDQRRHQQHQALLARTVEAQAQMQRWGRLSALIGSAEGERFRKIAQAYNLDMLVQHANLQLRQLVKRYRLRRGGSLLGLLVVDTEMGDETRSVHSLSGGETFLVSLALALGLASMASSTLKIESLFIDEGFGSLDPESLQLAMDALDSLQAQGRKVAVISHVQEMHERIPVQIQVRRQGNGLSVVEAVGTGSV